MFGLGFGELVLLAVIALLVFGPDQLPIVARNVARFLNELKRTTEEFKKELKVDEELSSTFNEIKQLRAKNLLEGPLNKKNPETTSQVTSSSSLPAQEQSVESRAKQELGTDSAEEESSASGKQEEDKGAGENE
ncbi:MAG: Sec-independent protein translocase protein TatB [Bdellovibrionaceae bacterium]|nr:Sec-independent protein translocase protein TatB [Pseudobdellovibrionaceae bacterium]